MNNLNNFELPHSLNPQTPPLSKRNFFTIPTNDSIHSIAEGSLGKVAVAYGTIKDPLDLNHCALTDEEIQANSLLNNDFSKNFPSNIELPNTFGSEAEKKMRLYANFLAAGLVTGGKDALQHGIDGFLPVANFQAWGWALQDLENLLEHGTQQTKNCIANLRKGIDQLYTLSKRAEAVNFHYRQDEKINSLQQLAQDCTRAIWNLNKKESYLMYGGWSNKDGGSGHAIIYEFKKVESRTFDVLIHTATDFSLTGNVMVGGKRRLKPLVRFKDVPASKLFFCSDPKQTPKSSFIQSLLELKYLQNIDKNFILDEEDVLEIFDHLEDFHVPATLTEYGSVTGQRSGSCVPSSTKKWIRFSCNDLNEYRTIMFYIILKFTCASYQTLKKEYLEHSENGALSRKILEHVSRDLLRSAIKGRETGIISEQKALQTIATAHDLLQKVAIANDKIKKEIKQTYLNVDISIPLENLETRRQNTRLSIIEPTNIRYRPAWKFPNFFKNLTDCNHNLLDFLAPYYIEEDSYLHKINGFESSIIHHLVDQLPIPTADKPLPETYSKLSLEDKEGCLKLFILILKDYYNYSQKEATTRRHATIFPLQAIAHHLACLIDKEKGSTLLQTFGIDYLGNEVNQLKQLVYLDSNEFKRLDLANNYFKKWNRSPNTVFGNQKETTSIVKNCVNDTCHGLFWQHLWINNRELCEKIDNKANLLWRDYTEQEITDEFQEQLQRYRESLEVWEKTKNKGRYLSPPSEPTLKLTNLPLDQKRTMLLEGSISNGFLRDNNYGYIDDLREITFICRRLLYSFQRNINLRIQISRYSNYRTDVAAYTNTPVNTFDPRVQEKIQDELYISEDDTQKKFLNLPFLKRNMSKWQKDIAEVLSTSEFEGDILFQKLLRVSSQWKIAPYQIIYEFEKEFNALASHSMQTLFYQFFFRSPISKSGAKLGVGTLLVQDLALRDRCKQFVSKGLEYFNKSKDNATAGAKFFFEFAYHCGKYLKEAGKQKDAKVFNLTNNLNHWLTKEMLQNERATFHFYRMLHISNLPQTEWTEELLCQFFESHCYFNIYHAKSCGISDVEKNDNSSFIKAFLAGNCENLKEKSALIFSSTLKKFGIEDELTLDAISSFPLLKGYIWNIDLVTGKIYGSEGELSGLSSNYLWEKQADFVSIFGKAPFNFEYVNLGSGNVSFVHPIIGQVRLVDAHKFNSFYIQRKFEGSKGWHQSHFMPSASSMFNYGHNFWISPHTSKHKGYITCNKDHQIKFVLHWNGKIQEWDDQEKRKGLYVDSFLPASNEEKTSHSFLNFDHEVLRYMNKKGDIQKIGFPRLSSQEGNALQFTNVNDVLVWNDNRQYHVASKTKLGYLGTFINYLHLQSFSKDNPEKLLVPFQPWVQKGTPYATGHLHISNHFSLLKDPQKRDEWGEHCYFVYNLINEKMTPTTVESSLYLAYLELGQKKFAESVRLIRSIKNPKDLSQTSLKILSMILELPYGEDDPNAKLVRLQALFIQMKAKDSRSNEKITSYFEQDEDSLRTLWNLTCNVTALKQSANNSSIFCKLSDEEELYIINNLLNDLITYQESIANLLEIPSNVIEAQKVNLNYHLKMIKGEIKLDQTVSETYASRDVPKSTKGRVREEFQLEDKDNRSWEYKLAPIKSDFMYLDENKVKNPGFIENSNSYFYGYSYTSYQRELNTYNRHVRLKTEWLLRGEIPKQCTRLDAHLKFENNGKLFLEVFRIALQGSELEKEEMLFKLKLWRLHLNETSYLCDFMINMLLNASSYNYLKDYLKPENYKRLCDDAHLEYKYEFLVKLKIYEYNPTKSKQFFYPQNHYPASKVLEKEGRFPLQINNLHLSKKKEEEKPIQALPLSLEKAIDYSEYLSSWKGKMSVARKEVSKTKDFEFTVENIEIAEEEKDYESSLKRDFELLSQDYEEGKKINDSQEDIFISQKDANEIAVQSDEIKKELESALDGYLAKLFLLINKKSKNLSDNLVEKAKIGGLIEREYTYEDALKLLLEGDFNAYFKLNPNLEETEIKELSQLTLTICDLKSAISQIKRIESLCTKIGVTDNVFDTERKFLSEKLYQELSLNTDFSQFDQEVQVLLRIFAGEASIIPFTKQMKLIERMIETCDTDKARFKDIVIQLIMGGGKTSVLATILLMLAAKKSGRLSLFIVPASLFETVKANLGESLYKAFKTDLASIDISREEMTAHRLNELLDQIEQGKKGFSPIIVKATTLQGLELEFLSLTRALKEICKEDEATQKEIERIENQINRSKGKLNTKITFDEKCKHEDRIKSLSAQLEFKKQKKAISQSRHKDIQLKLKPLSQIIACLPESADALIDEIDLVLDSLQEVNFPSGQKLNVSTERNALLLHLFKGLTSEEIKINELEGTPTIGEFVGLTKNQQSNMNMNHYRQFVTPLLATYIGKTFQGISNYIQGYETSFKKYVTDRIPTFVQDFILLKKNVNTENLNRLEKNWQQYGTIEEIKSDVQFLKFLDTLFSSDENEQVEAAHLIALTKHFLVDLTPSTLGKSAKRNYGLKPEASGSIIPYLAVDTPATTEFGYHWEAACYFYQWASFAAPSTQLIEDIAKKTDTTARYYVGKNGETYEETVEYKEFMSLFGVPLDKIHKPENLKQAQENISQNVHKCLDLQFEIISSEVTFNSERLTSNGMGLVSMLSSRRGMSGTPWNVDGYTQSLQQNFLPDIGTEGRILHQLAMRQKDKKIYTADLFSIENFFLNIYKDHPNSKKIRGVIDAGGLFKAFKNNKYVAKGYMKFLQDHPQYADPLIEGVLFFYKNPGQTQSDTLYVWKKGANRPEHIGGSSVDALKAKGLNPKNYAVIYDERHTTGVDILQVPEAINLFTFDEKMLRRMVGQGIMRLRQFLSSQNIEIVLTEESKKSLINEGRTYNDLIASAEKVQSIRKTRDLVKYYVQQIDDIFRKIAIQEVVKAVRYLEEDKKEHFIATINRYEKFFVTNMADEPYLQFGKLKRIVTTKEYLSVYLQKKLTLFRDTVLQENAVIGKNENAYEMAREQAGAMQAHIQKAEGLPEKWAGEAPDHLHVQQEVEMHVNVEFNQNIEVNTEIESEIELELQRYEAISAPNFHHEKKWELHSFKAFLEKTHSEKVTGIQSLQTQLKLFTYGFSDEIYPYHKAFSQPIYGTHAFFHSCTIVLPVFHKYQKPAKQILAVKHNGAMRWVLLSEREANDAKTHLKFLRKEQDPLAQDVWLIQADGTDFVKDKTYDDFPIEDEDIAGIEEGLVEINAFVGNADYLDKHASDTEDWLKKDSKLKIRFLKLKVARDKLQNETLRRSQPIMGFDDGLSHDTGLFKCKARLEKEKSFQGNLFPNSLVETKMLTSKKIRNLHVSFVKHLGIDPLKKDEATLAALELINQKIPAEIQGVERIKAKLRHAKKITDNQFNSLRRFHGPFITKEQLKWLPPEQMGILDNPDQICLRDANGKVIEYYLDEKQVTNLMRHQKKLIPYINPEYYSNFTQKWQVEAVPPKHIHQIKGTCLQFLSKKQMKTLNLQQIEGLKNSGLLPQKWGWIHGNFIEQVPSQFYGYINKEQLGEIDDENIIFHIEEISKNKCEEANTKDVVYTLGAWINQIDPSMVSAINFDKDLSLLKKKKHILYVPNEQIKKLDKDSQVPLIGESQVNFLTKEQLEKCPNALICHLDPARIPLLKDYPEKFAYLKGDEQIRSVDEEIFVHLVGKDNPNLGHVNQMTWISDPQLEFVTEKQVQGLTNAQLLSLKDSYTDHFDSIKNGLVKEQVVTFDTLALIELLSPVTIKYISKTQVPLLNEGWQIQGIENELVAELNKRQIKKAHQDQIPYLRFEEQISAVKDNKIKFLKAEEDKHMGFVNQMVWVSDDQLLFVQKDQVKGLTKDQLLVLKESSQEWENMRPEMTKAQVSTFDETKYFDLLTEDQIKNLISKEQVRFLETENQIRGLGNNQELLSELSPIQFQFLSDSQIKLLSTDQINKFDTKSPLFNRLTKMQLNEITLIDTLRKLPLDLIPSLDYSQYSLFEAQDKAFVEKLNNVQVSKLTAKDGQVIAMLAPKQMSVLQNVALASIGLNREQLKHVDKKKLHFLNIKQIKARNFSTKGSYAKHVFAALGKMTVFPFMVVGKLIYNIALSIFGMLRALFVPNKVNGRKLAMRLKKTFAVDPAIDFITILQLFHPAKYVKVKSRLLASAA